MVGSYLSRLFLMCFAIGAGLALLLNGMRLDAQDQQTARSAPRAAVVPGGDPLGGTGDEGVAAPQERAAPSVGARCLRGGEALAAVTPRACRRAGGMWTTKRGGLTGLPSGPVETERTLRRTVP